MEKSIELKSSSFKFIYIKKALLITGLPGSGKSVLANIAKERGINVISMGEMVFEETKRRGLELSSENVSKIAKKLREELGEGAVALLTLKKIAEEYDNKANSTIIIEGLRSFAEYQIFRSFLKETILVAVLASQERRYSRLKARQRSDVELDYWGLLLRDFREINFGIGDLISRADYYLLNESDDLSHFKMTCNKFLDDLLIR